MKPEIIKSADLDQEVLKLNRNLQSIKNSDLDVIKKQKLNEECQFR